MNTFVAHLQSATQYERIEGVASFIAEDESGKFGILAGHIRMLAILTFGLARLRIGEGQWQYLALPGGILYFVDEQLYITTRRYVRDTDYRRIHTLLQQQFRAEEKSLRGIKESLRHMEQEMLRRLWELEKHGETLL